MKNTKPVVFLIIPLLILGALFFGLKGINSKAVDGGKNTATTTSVVNQSDKIVYRNTEYKFEITLPDSWKGYSEIREDWEGDTINAKGEVILGTVRGPIVLIRHPKWMEEFPRQDIPIMIFTRSQWEDLVTDKFHIGSAPIGPSDLGRNVKYIFALPARYNYTYLPGFEEVGQILESGSFITF